MKFTCEKNQLVSAISVASRTVAQKSAISGLEGILVRAGVKVMLTGYNLETGITVSVDADIQETGACVMPARLFFDIVRKLPDDTVSIQVDESFKVSIKGGISSFTITALSADDYPELPDVDSEKGIRVPQNELKAMISGTIFAVSENQARPIHTGVLFEVDNDSITSVAVDGYRLALRRFYELMKLDPPPMAGLNLYSVLYGSSFKFDRRKAIEEVNALTDRIQKEYEEGNRPIEKRPRILVTGCPIGGNAMKVVKSIEENGGNVVCFENCSGAKSVDELINEDTPDIYQAIADRYLNIGCSCMTPDENRFKLLGRLLEEYKIDAVVEVILQACHTYNVESYYIKRFVTGKGLPYMCVETDYSSSDIGQLNTRCAAFIEML